MERVPITNTNQCKFVPIHAIKAYSNDQNKYINVLKPTAVTQNITRSYH